MNKYGWKFWTLGILGGLLMVFGLMIFGMCLSPEQKDMFSKIMMVRAAGGMPVVIVK